jgi:NAD(P)H dehydrogenase (quinone)
MAQFDNRPKILVTGATGKAGAAVVAQLLEKGWPVWAIVRSRDARSAELDRLGAETVIADLFDPDQMVQAMRGTLRAYYCPPLHPYAIQSTAAFVAAARVSKLEAIVGLSQWLASPTTPPCTRANCG